MSSIARTNIKRFFRPNKGLMLNPQNNRKRTRGRIIQIDPKTGKKITHG